MPLDDQLGSGQRQDALKPLGFLTVGQYRVEAYLQVGADVEAAKEGVCGIHAADLG